MGRKEPEQFIGGPEIRWGLEVYYDAFRDLDTERSHGSGWTRISWSDIVRYAAYYGFTDDQTSRVVAHIYAMDLAYIKKLDDDAEAKRKA